MHTWKDHHRIEIPKISSVGRKYRPGPDSTKNVAKCFEDVDAVKHQWSQWVFNVRPFISYMSGNSEGQPLRFTKQMLLIFVLDAIMAVVNAAAAATSATSR